MTDRELMQQALEALEIVIADVKTTPSAYEAQRQSIAALRKRLAQPEKGPVAWESFFKRYCPWLAQPERETVAWEVGVVNGVVTRRLAQPEQEPTAERAWFTIAELNAWADKKLSENPHWVMPKDKPERDEPPPQRKPEQEPVARVIDNGTLEGATEWIPFTNRVEPLKTGDLLYTSPPQRTWVDLTDFEILEEIPITKSRPVTSFARAILTKFKEKNT